MIKATGQADDRPPQTIQLTDGGFSPRQVTTFNSIASAYERSPLIRAADRTIVLQDAVKAIRHSTVKSELADRFVSFGEAKTKLFDYIEVFYNQRRRHSTLGQISPAAFERGAAA